MGLLSSVWITPTRPGTNYRGWRADAVDILYECRNITGWVPPPGGEWWEHLPDFGEHTWQERATRRKGQAVMRVAFIPTKFRLGIEPEPFVLAINTQQEPWTLADVTETMAAEGERAAEETSRQERAKIAVAEETLVRAITARSADTPCSNLTLRHCYGRVGSDSALPGRCWKAVGTMTSIRPA